MVRVVCFLCLVLAGVPMLAQSQYGQEALVSMTDMIRYQHAKVKDAKAIGPFAKYGMRRIRASRVLADDDPRSIWGFRVNANTEYDKDRQPLYKLFRKNDFASMVAIDYASSTDNKCELLFWGKKYYRRFSHELRRMGYEMRASKRQTNVLEFRKKDIDVGIDITIWPDIYIVTFLVVGGE